MTAAFGAICPHCDTLFKVYPDQLRIHNGFANCGGCGHTFDVQAVLMFLPNHVTSFLERSSTDLDGLPILNAVVEISSNKPTQTPTTEPKNNSSITSSSAPLSIKIPEPSPTSVAHRTVAGKLVQEQKIQNNTTKNVGNNLTKDSLESSVSSLENKEVVKVVPKKITENLANNTKIPTLNFIKAPDIVPEPLRSSRQLVETTSNSHFSLIIKGLILVAILFVVIVLFWVIAEPEQKNAIQTFVSHYVPQTEDIFNRFDIWLQALSNKVKGSR